MKRFFVIVCLLAGLRLMAQTGDSSALQRDAANAVATAANAGMRQNIDSASNAAAADPQKPIVEKLTAEALRHASLPNTQQEIFFPKWLSSAGVASYVVPHPQSDSSDWIFFALIGITLVLGITKIIFPQHFSQLFQFTLHLRGYRKTVFNDNGAAKIVSSLLLNLLFFITASWCIVWVGIRGFSLEKQGQYWLYVAAALFVAYSVKYSVVTFSGWIFDAKKETFFYNYVVFSINKIVGVLLVPVIILMTYCISQISLAMRFILIIFALLLLVYRYIATFILIRENSEVNVFHFFLYLCTVEIMPLLLAYKLLLINWGKLI